jgi:hypothetical protein
MFMCDVQAMLDLASHNWLAHTDFTNEQSLEW